METKLLIIVLKYLHYNKKLAIYKNTNQRIDKENK